MGPSPPAEQRHLAERCRICCLRRVPNVSTSAMLPLSWLNPPPHPITVYASHPPSPTTAQHSLPGGALPPYRGRSFTGRNASASPDAPEPEVRIHLPPPASPAPGCGFWGSRSRAGMNGRGGGSTFLSPERMPDGGAERGRLDCSGSGMALGSRGSATWLDVPGDWSACGEFTASRQRR